MEFVNMLLDNYTQGTNPRKQTEFRNINKEILPWFEDVAIENNCKIEKNEWKSKYNSYVVYDYEPFCSEGFEINVTLSSHCQEYLDFLRYLYENKLEIIKYLKNCIPE